MQTKLFGLLLTLFVGLFLACNNDNSSGSDGPGRLIVQLTDAPFPHHLVAETNIIISKIDARLKEGKKTVLESDSTETVMDHERSPFIVLTEETIEVNLLELTNGLTMTLVDKEVPAGTYNLIRLYVTGANVVLKDSAVFDLRMPSGEQSGVKVFIQPELFVGGGLTSDLLLDFNVSRSFVARGNASNINGFIFKPVIKATNNSIAGTLSGKVTSLQQEMPIALEGAQISVFAADTLNTTTFTDASGMYTVMGLTAGSYDVITELQGYEPQTVEDVIIIAANKTEQGFELQLSE